MPIIGNGRGDRQFRRALDHGRRFEGLIAESARGPMRWGRWARPSLQAPHWANQAPSRRCRWCLSYRPCRVYRRKKSSGRNGVVRGVSMSMVTAMVVLPSCSRSPSFQDRGLALRPPAGSIRSRRRRWYWRRSGQSGPTWLRRGNAASTARVRDRRSSNRPAAARPMVRLPFSGCARPIGPSPGPGSRMVKTSFIPPLFPLA